MHSQEYLQDILASLQAALGADAFGRAERDLAGDSLMAQFEEGFQPMAADSVEDLISMAFGIEQTAIRLWTAAEDEFRYLAQARAAFETAAKLFERVAEAESIPSRRVHLDLYLHSAVDFSLGEFQANATVLARKVLQRFEFEEDTHSRVLKSVFLLLRRDLVSLLAELSDLVTPKQALEEAIQRSAAAGTLDQAWACEKIAHVITLEAVVAFAHYLRSGDNERYQAAARGTESALRIFDSLRDPDNFVLSQLISLLIRQMHHSSLWHQLGDLHGFRDNPILARYLRVLATDRRPIYELWQSQVQALPDAFGDRDSLVLQMPTSAGKTRVAEFKIAHTLATNHDPVRCIYVAPFKSLASQVHESLEYYLGKLGYRVTSVFGSYESVEFEDSLLEQSDVVVITPEKLDYMVRQDKPFFESVKLLVVDEGHILDSDVRGLRLEILLHRLLRAFSRSGLQVLFISAVVPNTEEIATWLTRGEPVIVESTWKPTKLRQGIFYWGPDWRGRIWYRDEGFDFITGIRRGLVREYRKDRPHERLKKPIYYPDSKYDIAIELALELLTAAPTILFTAVRSHVDSVARKLNDRIQALRDRDRDFHLAPDRRAELEVLASKVEDRLGHGFPLAGYIREGFAYHHGQLPEDLRGAVEQAFRAEQIPILIATPTLAHGVNLPVHLMIVANLERGADPFLIRDFRNIAGRAGRALHETEGQVIFVQKTQSIYRVARVEPYLRDDEIERVQSALFRLYEQLVERKLGISLEEFLTRTRPVAFDDRDLVGVSDLDRAFQTQILALLYEELIDEADPDTVERALSQLLFGVQCELDRIYHEPLTEYGRLQVRYLTAAFSSAQQKSAFYKTGLSLQSCQTMESRIRHLASDGVFARMRDPRTGLLDDLTIARVLTLADLAHETRSNYTGSVDLAQAAIEWIHMADVTELVRQFGPTDPRFQKPLFVSDLVYRHFMNDIPWALNSVLKILGYLREEENVDFDPEWSVLPSYVKYGVNTPVAAYVSSMGVADRAVARSIAEYYYRELSSTLLEPVELFQEWVQTLSFEDMLVILEDPVLVQQTMSVLRRHKPDARPVDYFTNPKSVDFKTYVVGTRYEGRLTHLSRLSVGDDLRLVREPDNPFDPNAMAVLTATGEKVGYIRMSKAFVLSTLSDEGWQFSCHVERLYPAPRHPNRRLLLHVPPPSHP